MVFKEKKRVLAGGIGTLHVHFFRSDVPQFCEEIKPLIFHLKFSNGTEFPMVMAHESSFVTSPS